ncbi:ABC transporter substrate-binding protein [Spirochaeta cellobiosiphila]|uniref:ABC transporter substrate-binding protein n=1 Tax=Spirochaeta cellobiosiphila TaxID=504483 RepID=UPI001FE04017|nr:extracellular solute-binding protein [Spirochaeta cellobiosiphila]
MKRLLLFTLILSFTVLTSPLMAEGQQDKNSGKTTITWWALSGGGGADDVREKWRKELISTYEASHPNVNIELTMMDVESFKQKIQVAIPAGNAPDLFASWGGGVMNEYAKAGALKDITPYVKKELAPYIGAGALSVYSYQGHYYGAPYDMGAVGMWYNKKIFKELGVDVPKTWPELLNIVKKAKAAGYVPVALGGGDRWPTHYWWVYLAMRMGGQEAFDRVVSGQGSFNDKSFVQAGEKLLELAALDPFQEGYLGSTYDNESALMGNGKAAMELMGQWAPGVQEANSETGKGLGDDLGWFNFPSIPGGKGKNTDVMGGGGGYVLSADAPEEAKDFLKFFLTKENNMAAYEVEGVIPVVKGAEAALEGQPNAQKIVQAVQGADYYQLYYDQYLPPAVGEAVKDAATGILAGLYTPAEAAALIDATWQSEK